MHKNYQALTNFASFSFLYFSLFSFVVIFCSILYYWFDESVSESLESLEGVEQIEIDILL